MRIPNPEARIWKQTNSGETPWDANLVGTFNADLSRKPGKVLPSSRMKQVFNVADNSNFSTPFSFLYFAEFYWAFCRRVFKTSGAGSLITSWVQDTSTGVPSPSDVQSDAVIFDNGIVVSKIGNQLARYVEPGGWSSPWTSFSATSTPISAISTNPMETINIGSPVLCIGDNNILTTITGSGSYTVTPRLTLDLGQRIKWIRAGTSQAYIGTHPRRTSGKGIIYIWDGGSTQPTRSIVLNSRGASTAVVHDDILYIVTMEGEIQRLDGSGFTTVAKFPIFESNYMPLNFDSQQSNNSFIHQRGSAVRKGKLLFNIQGGVHRDDGKYIPHNHSGIWEYDPATGSLSHKHGFSTNKTGDADYGQPFAAESTLNYPGALFTGADRDGTLLAGFGYATQSSKFTGASTALFIDDIEGTQSNLARLTFPQAFAKEISGFHNRIVVKYQPMKAGQEIVLKYRTTEKDPIGAVITWVSATEFTSTTDLSDVEVGDEVFVLQSKGGGDSAQVATISETGGTYTVTLNRSIIGVVAAETTRVAFQNWKLLESFTDTVGSVRTVTVPVNSGAWLQVTAELRGDGTGPILEELAILEDKAQ